MRVTVTPKKLSGAIDAIASKSYAHRMLIASALCDEPTKIWLNTTSEDIEATKECIKRLGALIDEHDGYIVVTPPKKENILKKPILDCNESGSTARFMLPVAAALSEEFSMVGGGRLPMRPHTPLIEQMRKKGVKISSNTLPLNACGKLSSGVYEIAGNISSQYITGLLLALPLLDKPSTIKLTTKLESAAYIDITTDVLSQFGIEIKKTPTGYEIPSAKYISPKEITVEGDWSNTAFWIVADHISGDINVRGMNKDSFQGDKKICSVLSDEVIDASEIPDLVPILAVCACAKNGKTVIKNAERLRLKESDRLKAVTETLTGLGADVKELPDGLIINGHGFLDGGVCESFGDHRIVMSAAIASTICKSTVTINGAEAVNKSYPTFFDDFKSLGGEIVIE